MEVARWKRGLFTHEDPFNVHKLLGFPCLLHFVGRTLSLPYRPFSDMFFTSGPETPALLAMHLCLSCSSLVFHIPKVRIKEGSRIWPEFRLHSIVFACRSLACMLLVWLERRFDPEGPPRYWANVVIVFATLIAADIASNSVDPISRSNTIRGLQANAFTKFAFSYMQFLGTCGCLVGLRAFAGQFAIVFIIQTYAFTLTLRRKNLVSHRKTVIFYAYQLSIGASAAQIEIWQAGGLQAMAMFPALAACVALLRVGLELNKYVVWAIMAAFVQIARRTTPIVAPEDRIAGWPEWAWPVLAVVTLATAFTVFARKSAAREAARAQQDAVASKASAALSDMPSVSSTPPTREKLE